MHADPDELPWSVYRTLTGAVLPRPVAWVSTTSPDGVDNLAPFSFFTVASVDPPILAFAPMDQSANGARKDTTTNVDATGEFVVNVVTEDLVEAMNETSRTVAPSVDEFEEAGVDRRPSVRVAPPAVRDAIVSFECTLYESLRLETSTLLLGAVVHVHVAERALNDEGKLNARNVDAVGRLAGTGYTTLEGWFDMERPK